MLVEALSGRADVTVSLPYEPGRPAFASLTRTSSDLSRLASGKIVELPPVLWGQAPALAHLERALFGGSDEVVPPLDGAVRFLEAAGSRGVLELAAEEILDLLRLGTPPASIAIVCPSVERYRAPLDTVFGALGIPYAIEGSVTLDRTPFGRALLNLLRFAWLGGTRRHLFGFLRSGFSGLPRVRTDFVEGRLRGRAVSDPARVEEEAVKLLGHPLVAVDRVRDADTPIDAVRLAAAAMLQASYGLERPPTGAEAGLDLRAHEAVLKVARDLETWEGLTREQLVAALEQASVRVDRAAEQGRVAVIDLQRARTRRFEAVIVLGLEEGRLPAPQPGDAVPAGRGAQAARRRGPRPPPRAARPARARPLPLLHGLHATAAAARPRPRGGVRRRPPARGEPVLGRGARVLRSRRGRAVHARPQDLGADLGPRACAERARTAARRRRRSARTSRTTPGRSRSPTAGSGGSTAPSPRSSGRPS